MGKEVGTAALGVQRRSARGGLYQTPRYAAKPYSLKRHLLRPALRLFLPLGKQSRIILRDVIRPRHSQLVCRRINPSRGPLNLAKVSNRCLIHPPLPLPISPPPPNLSIPHLL